MTSDGPALLAEICSNPEEDSVRLAFADWLEEQPKTYVRSPMATGVWEVDSDGKTHWIEEDRTNRIRAELIRAQIERARLKPRPLICTHVATVPPVATGRGLFSVIANFSPNAHPDLKTRDAVFDVAVLPGGLGHRILSCSVKTFDVLSDGSWSVLFHATQEPCPVRVRCDELEAQIVRLNKETNHCPELGYTWVNEDYYYGEIPRQPPTVSFGRLRRGFVEEVVCTAEEWLKIEGALVFHPKHLMECPTCTDPKWKRLPGIGCPGCKDGGAPIPCPLTAHPIRKVQLTTRHGAEGRVFWKYAFSRGDGEKFWRNPQWPGIEFELSPPSLRGVISDARSYPFDPDEYARMQSAGELRNREGLPEPTPGDDLATEGAPE